MPSPLKISDMTLATGTPSVAGAMLPIVIPGDMVNYRATIATLLTTATGENLVITVSGANIILNGVPTTDPGVTGALWNNGGVLCVSL